MKSKVISVRLHLGDYADFLKECAECDKEPSELAREKLLSSGGVSPNNDKVSVLESKLEQLNKELDKAKKSNTILENQLKKEKAHYNKSLGGVKSQATKAKNNEAALKAKIKDLDNELQKKIKAVSNLEKALSECMSYSRKAGSNSKNELSKKDKIIDTLNKKINSVNDNLKDCKKEALSYKDRLEKANTWLKSKEVTESLFSTKIVQF